MGQLPNERTVMTDLDSLSRGRAFAAQGRQEDAIGCYTEALREDPSNPWAYCERGRVYLDEPAKQDQALADFNEAIRLDPSLALAYNGRGVVYKNRGDLDQAITDYSEALGAIHPFSRRGTIEEPPTGRNSCTNFPWPISTRPFA